jgi:16S rRNA (cytidine1402-2'-O)-methyltransferase
LAHIGAEPGLVRCDDHTEKRVAEKICDRIEAGETGALVSDAGTPGVSDPGYAVVAAALARQISIVPIPGPSAILAALCAAGLPTHAFRFEGYLPVKEGARRRRLETLAEDDATQVFFVPPHKLCRWLPDLLAVFGDRRACLARELTKKFEEFHRGTLSSIEEHFSKRNPRGEMVLMVAGKS